MEEKELTGAIRALLDEYRKALNELIEIIKPLSSQALLHVENPADQNPDSRSIQGILSHVVASCYSYAIYIENHIGIESQRPQRYFFEEVQGYIDQLNHAFEYNLKLFARHPEIALEELAANKKIVARWGQQYDVEQMLEHAIVHILRHRRQIALRIRHLKAT